MPLIIPSHQDYTSASERVISGIEGLPEKVDWCIYGSFVTGKVRPGLSDIDIFLLSYSKEILFPARISRVFSETKSDVERLGIPLQISYTTKLALLNPFASPDYFYLQEVKRGIEFAKASGDFSGKFHDHRKSSTDDIGMARYFLKKVSGLPTNVSKIFEILGKSEQDITFDYQKELQKFWDAFKKMLSFCTLSVRILDGESVFNKSDNEIFEQFRGEVGNIDGLDYFLEILENIQSIEDWYRFLKEENGIEKIMKLYDTTFQKIASEVSKHIGRSF